VAAAGSWLKKNYSGLCRKLRPVAGRLRPIPAQSDFGEAVDDLLSLELDLSPLDLLSPPDDEAPESAFAAFL
jgi:hypothetical protein